MQVILAAVDFSRATDQVLDAVGVLARMAPSRVVLVHSFQPSSLPDLVPPEIDALGRGEEKAASERLEQVRMGLENDGISCEARLIYGTPGRAIVEEAKASRASYIVIGSQGHGSIRQLLVGSTTVYLLQHGPCPVLAIPPGAFGASGYPALETAGAH